MVVGQGCRLGAVVNVMVIVTVGHLASCLVKLSCEGLVMIILGSKERQVITNKVYFSTTSQLDYRVLG